MVDQKACAPPVIVTFPAQVNAVNAEHAAGQIGASFTRLSMHWPACQ